MLCRQQTYVSFGRGTAEIRTGGLVLPAEVYPRTKYSHVFSKCYLVLDRPHLSPEHQVWRPWKSLMMEDCPLGVVWVVYHSLCALGLMDQIGGGSVEENCCGCGCWWMFLGAAKVDKVGVLAASLHPFCMRLAIACL